MSLRFNVCLGVVFSLFAGCGSEQDSRIPPRDTVSGNITLDGEPLSGGSISFFSPEDAAMGIQASTSVINGKYELLVTPGEKKVKISQVVDTSETNTENLIPAKYNSQTTLKADVSNENRSFDFDLNSS